MVAHKIKKTLKSLELAQQMSGENDMHKTIGIKLVPNAYVAKCGPFTPNWV